jgi:hypothetical protein
MGLFGLSKKFCGLDRQPGQMFADRSWIRKSAPQPQRKKPEQRCSGFLWLI